MSPAIEQIYNAENQFQNLKKLSFGSIKIGTSNTILRYFLLPHLKCFSKKYPQISIQIEEQYNINLMSMVKDGNINLAIMLLPEKVDLGLEIIKCCRLTYCLVGNKKYHSIAGKKIPFETLVTNHNLILNTINSSQLDFLSKSINLENYTPYITLASHSLIYEFVKNGFGIGLAIKEYIANDLKNGSLVEIDSDIVFPELNLAIVIKDNIPSYATKEFINIICEN